MSPAKVIRLNVSSGYSPSSASFIVSFAFSIGKPDIDPDVSSTKTISFGVRSSRAILSGGCRISVKKPPRSLAVREDRVLDLARPPRRTEG